MSLHNSSVHNITQFENQKSLKYFKKAFFIVQDTCDLGQESPNLRGKRDVLKVRKLVNSFREIFSFQAV